MYPNRAREREFPDEASPLTVSRREAAPRLQPEAGCRIGHYEVQEPLGEGGMGAVYKARDKHLDRFVAIKVLPPERVAAPDRMARFVQEARAASALTISDIGAGSGRDFIAMEYVAGKTLDSEA
jgi:eukaryotic-like serine/threonine-protein kinase